ncbi:MAG: bifunctional adenosylcobinamide kinase/adenosylcobinamide-phosphate guanylyltransferase [Synergistaceae bacterium]|jgi:adenosylcobinamide kinase/adenosylcobinamide-phosphate guanylyltransferase|nr:bifunctional adenosylcobinamide kinase/adenosylcobinamide-phosphate guanylyltransferase [Synergistaceae bacterium]
MDLETDITLILGGARSGKSSFAEALAREAGGAVTFIATADSRDAEMEARIKLHRDRRPADWLTWEGEMESLPDEIAEMRGTLLLDCLTMYLSRLFLASPLSESDCEDAWLAEESRILARVERLFAGFAAYDACGERRRLIVVSNEVGLGLVPPFVQGRRFRDVQGRANQIAARFAGSVAFMAAGLPMWMKGGWKNVD